MTQAVKPGDTIAVEYTGKLETGEVFDSSQGKKPLTFTVGAGMLIKGFDQAVIGMKTGESKTVTIPPEQGYGPINEEAFVDIPKTHIPDEIPLEQGLELQLQDPQGRPVPARVAEISDESVKMDINHVLAGKTLVFDITIAQTGLTPPKQDCGCGCGTDAQDCGTGCEGGCGQ